MPRPLHSLRVNRITILLIAAISPLFSLAQGIVITSGANLVVNGNANIVVNDGGFTNNGVFTPGTGTVIVTGTASPTITTIGGTATLGFYNLSLNKSAGSAKLAKNASVSNNINMLQGILDLSGFDLNLGATGSISGETATAYISGASGGAVVRTVTLNAPNAFNPGNIGIEITSSANLGATTIRRGHAQQVSASGYSINRYYDIAPANNTALNATVKFYYLDGELATINESQLKMWASANNGATWSLLGADAQDATGNFVLKNGINQLNRLTLASSVTNPLPVTFLSFDGQLSGNNVNLKWATGVEINNHHFEVERSFDGRNFTSIAVIQPSGNAAGGTYQSADVNPFSVATAVYYRIRQVSNDGTSAYTRVLFFSKGIPQNKFIGVYPNPGSGNIRLRFVADGSVKATELQLFDNMGKVVASKKCTVTSGLNEVQMNIAQLVQGTYYIRLSGVDIAPVRILKN